MTKKEFTIALLKKIIMHKVPYLPTCVWRMIIIMAVFQFLYKKLDSLLDVAVKAISTHSASDYEHVRYRIEKPFEEV